MEGVVTHNGDMFKLISENDSYWKPMIEDHLYYKDLQEPITQKDKPEGKITGKEWELQNQKAVAMIQKYIDESLFEHVSTYTNEYKSWKKNWVYDSKEDTSEQNLSCEKVGKVGVQRWS